MKKFFSIFVLMAGLLFASASILLAQSAGANAPAASSTLSAGTVISAVLVVYEAVIRLVPTVRNNSLIHSVISILASISDFLNVKKKT